MFNTATPYQGSVPIFQEAYVAGVDVKRHECRCRLDSGQTVTAVRWLGDKVPSEQDTVLLVKLPNGRFIILDKIAIPTRSPNPLPGLGTGEPEEVANFSALQLENSTNSLVPSDIRPGDKVMASEGGGLIAALRGGSVILKAGGLSQLLLSPFDSLGRLVTQNWEHHTGVDSVYKVNMGGKTYIKTELFDSPSAAASGQPSQIVLEGDVAAAGGPGGFRVRQTLDDGGVVVQTVTENRDGSTHQNIQTGGSSVDIKSGIDGYSVTVNGGVGSSIVLGEDSAKVHCGGSEVTLTDSGIELKIGGSVCKLTDSEFKVKTTTFTVDAAEYNFA